VPRKSQELRPVMTRIPEALRRRLEREAEQNRRSMNAEIIRRLEDSFRRQDQQELIAETVEKTLAALEATREALGPAPPAEPKSYGGLFGPFSKERDEAASKNEGDKS
jgi:Arc-like DNA binding dprotein